MNNNRIITLVCILIIQLAACSPSPQAIQTAIVKTQVAWTPTYTTTFTPQPTSTRTPLPPTHTPLPPTKTPVPKTTYILETGWCLLQAGDIGNVDPKTVQSYGVNICPMEKREQIQLASSEQVELTLWNGDGGYEAWCALFSLDGTFIMSDVDTVGSAKVICHP